jgi:hypothetical protein
LLSSSSGVVGFSKFMLILYHLLRGLVLALISLVC